MRSTRDERFPENLETAAVDGAVGPSVQGDEPSASTEAMSVVRIQSGPSGATFASSSPSSPAAVRYRSRVDDASWVSGRARPTLLRLASPNSSMRSGRPRAERAGEFRFPISQPDRDAKMLLELVAGFRVERARRADQELQRRQVVGGHVGIEQHAEDGGLHTGPGDAVGLDRVDEASTVNRSRMTIRRAL